MKPTTQSNFTLTVFALNVIVSLVLIPHKPDGAAVALTAIAVFSLVWFIVKLTYKHTDPVWIESKTRNEILFAMILAGLLLLASISATLAKELAIVDSETVERISGIGTGLMLVLMGNFMPKRLMNSSGCCASKSKKSASVQRMMGWCFVLGGLLYAGIWLLVDIENTPVVILFTFPIAIAIVILIRLIYMKVSGTKDDSSTMIGEQL
jgi:hypothetical protein